MRLNCVARAGARGVRRYARTGDGAFWGCLAPSQWRRAASPGGVWHARQLLLLLRGHARSVVPSGAR